MSKAKDISDSIEDLGQILSQLEENLKSAHSHNNTKLAKDIERSIKTTKILIQRLKSAAVKK
jgi:hypothetical protein